MIAYFSIHHESPVSVKNDHIELHKANVHERAAFAETLHTKTNAKILSIWCYDHQNWTVGAQR